MVRISEEGEELTGSTLQISHLCTGFVRDGSQTDGLQDVSVQIPRGSIVGIVGESGCGKSMTACSVMGLLRPPCQILSGSICLTGKELTGLTDREMTHVRGEEISMIFQEPMTSLNPVMKVGKQVQEAVLLHRRTSRKEAKTEVLRMFRKVGISDPERRYYCYPHELSGGLRQRIMIAMAMICRPRLLIADEPTTALDVTVEAQILELMKSLQQEFGTSILLISHNLGVVSQICDYVYVMYAGRVVEQADTAALFEAPVHPYTAGLMDAARSLMGRQKILRTIPGAVPALEDLPSGCSFAPRCPYCTELCRKTEPELGEISENHRVRCYFENREV